jgi:hypothetical protein
MAAFQVTAEDFLIVMKPIATLLGNKETHADHQTFDQMLVGRLWGDDRWVFERYRSMDRRHGIGRDNSGNLLESGLFALYFSNQLTIFEVARFVSSLNLKLHAWPP